jgi:hypothetical protein
VLVIKRRTALLKLVLSCALIVAWPDLLRTQTHSPSVALTHVTIIDVTGSAATTDMTVVIRGQHIVAIGKTNDIVIPPETDVIEASGKFLIPGLWDMYIANENIPREISYRDALRTGSRSQRLGPGSELAFSSNGGWLLEIVKEMHEAGVKFMAGTDAPNLIAAPGVSLHTELELLSRAGFTPLEALQAATIRPAEYLGLRDEMGTVDVGKLADLVLLDADPLVNIANTRQVTAVVLRGRLLFKPELEVLANTISTTSTPIVGRSLPGFGIQTSQENRTTAGKQPKPNVDEIREAQQRLSDLGYWIGRVDGIVDAAFSHALIAFQKVEGRQRTGHLVSEDLQALRLAKRPRPLEGGTLHVEIDLARQVLFLVDKDGTVSKILPVSTGNNNRFTSEGWTRRAHTPTGRFEIYAKISGWRKSALGLMYYPNYVVGGVAIHGSLSVPAHPASHGCIRIPMYAAKEFSEITPVGTPVVVHSGEPQP